MELIRLIDDLDKEKYVFVEYFLKSSVSLYDAAWNVAVGQSIGNPSVRNQWETDELFENHACKIIGNKEKLLSKKSGKVGIAFPIANLDFQTDGISQLLCQIMGGQLDIDSIKKCHVLSVEFPKHVEETYFKGPRFGFEGARQFTGIYDKPLLGGIIKPKVGVTPEILLEMVKEMVEGGVNFIKEDEIMSNPSICPIEVRVPLIMDYLKYHNVVYAVCINSDPAHLLDRVKQVYELGGNAIHVNFWSGLGSYKSIRELDLPIFLFFQKSGDKILTDKSHRFHIEWNVVCKLAGMMGVDFIHAGMVSGYSNYSDKEMERILTTLKEYDVVPSLSCGMHPGLVQNIIKKVGVDFLANTGGAIHGHKAGSKAGTKAMCDAINGNTDSVEYLQAIKQWGLVE